MAVLNARSVGLGILAASTAVVAAWLVWPAPVPVDLAVVTSGPLEVTINDEGKTRVRHVYAVSAPVAGTVLRISHPKAPGVGASLHVGDAVVAGETVVAVLRPAVPGLLDVRSREELQSAVAAAEASVRLAEAEIVRIQAGLDFAASELTRASALARTDAISARNLDKATFDVASSKAALASARAQLDVRRNELALARARLIEPTKPQGGIEQDCCVQVRAPVSGRVLRILQESETTVQAGVPILELGDTRDLEVVADLLTTEAVQIPIAADVRITGWGGLPLRGKVSRVEPAAFTKISALGIEEQRVRTVIDFADTAEQWAQLGHDFRVNVEVVTWRSEKALTMPVSALFRAGGNWSVFVVEDGRARLVPVQIGHRTNRQAEVLGGLSVGDVVILHPSDRVGAGRRVAKRAA